MRAVEMTAPGEPEVLRLVELPEPEVRGEHDVKVRLRAAGINPADCKQRASGAIGGTLPVVLGADGAGVVESTGPGVTRFRPEDEVYFCDGGFGAPGTYQEVRIVDERFLARKPRRLPFAEAAAAPLVTITAWEALRGRARVGRDQQVLVQAGAASGTCPCRSRGPAKPAPVTAAPPGHQPSSAPGTPGATEPSAANPGNPDRLFIRFRGT